MLIRGGKSKYGGADIHLDAGSTDMFGYSGGRLVVSTGGASDSASGSFEAQTSDSSKSGDMYLRTGTAWRALRAVTIRSGDSTGGNNIHWHPFWSPRQHHFFLR